MAGLSNGFKFRFKVFEYVHVSENSLKQNKFINRIFNKIKWILKILIDNTP